MAGIDVVSIGHPDARRIPAAKLRVVLVADGPQQRLEAIAYELVELGGIFGSPHGQRARVQDADVRSTTQVQAVIWANDRSRREVAREVLQKFATRAFRRPVSAASETLLYHAPLRGRVYRRRPRVSINA